MATIEEILNSRSAFLKGSGGNRRAAQGRMELTKSIEHNYPVFEVLRDELLGDGTNPKHEAVAREECFDLFDKLQTHDVIVREADQFCANGRESRRFMTGGWLEELAWLAAMEAGADEALFSQLVGWNVGGFSGENEIDVIVRRGERLGFISCKALRSRLRARDRKHRARLMEAVHEADNLADHFGEPGEQVGVLVTTDLYDERRGQHRYQALMGKAAVLDVRVIPLEKIGWDKLVRACASLIHD